MAQRADAVFAVLASAHAAAPRRLRLGTDAYPDRSATLVVEVPDLHGRADAAVARPGHRRPRELSPSPASPDDFWHDWAANHGLFPCGVDLVFTAGTELCALPRSIAVEG